MCAVRQQQAAAHALEYSSSLVHQIATPIQEVLCEAGELVSVGLAHGKQAMRNLIKAVERQAERISLGEVAALKLPEECYKDVSLLITKITTSLNEHIGDFLTFIGEGEWRSPQGLIYGPGSKEGHRIKHVLRHTQSDFSKPVHSVFNVLEKEVLVLIDEAWSIKDAGSYFVQQNGNIAYTIPMNKAIGTQGERIMRIIMDGDSMRIMTAYPIK